MNLDPLLVNCSDHVAVGIGSDTVILQSCRQLSRWRVLVRGLRVGLREEVLWLCKKLAQQPQLLSVYDANFFVHR